MRGTSGNRNLVHPAVRKIVNARTAFVAMTLCLGLGVMPLDSMAARCAPEDFLAINSGAQDGTAGATVKQVKVTESQLMQLPDASITTATQWSNGKNRYDGPRLSDVMALARVRGQSIRLFARNDYSVSIPWSDMENYGVILALSKDGTRLTAQDFGPLFLMYPRDDYAAELDTPSGVEKFIWQVCRIDVQ